jgi:hypothetical protein
VPPAPPPAVAPAAPAAPPPLAPPAVAPDCPPCAVPAAAVEPLLPPAELPAPPPEVPPVALPPVFCMPGEGSSLLEEQPSIRPRATMLVSALRALWRPEMFGKVVCWFITSSAWVLGNRCSRIVSVGFDDRLPKRRLAPQFASRPLERSAIVLP